MLVSAHEVMAGRLTVGDVVLLNTFLLQLYIPLSFLGVVYRQLKQAIIDLEMIHGLMQRRPEVADAEDAELLAVAGASIRFDAVSFAYDPRRPAGGCPFKFRPGSKLASAPRAPASRRSGGSSSASTT